MSWMTKEGCINELKSVSEESPRAIFRSNLEGKQYTGLYDIVFANTVVTQRRIQQGDIGYLGTFHCKNWTMAQHKLEREENLSKVATRSK
ncbi:MAG: hypothetical protein K0U59_06525 [Gammaproteobacteria bacterium]|nr:hypothetical protein [Gammaproteobacteria bacterium]